MAHRRGASGTETARGVWEYLGNSVCRMGEVAAGRPKTARSGRTVRAGVALRGQGTQRTHIPATDGIPECPSRQGCGVGGPGPLMAAARNRLNSLNGAMADSGI